VPHSSPTLAWVGSSEAICTTGLALSAHTRKAGAPSFPRSVREGGNHELLHNWICHPYARTGRARLPEPALSEVEGCRFQHRRQTATKERPRTYAQFVEKLRDIHCNPVKAGLCKRPGDWPWSSFRHYATGAEGRVGIECERTSRKREREAGRL
jgi:hypothetical protein